MAKRGKNLKPEQVETLATTLVKYRAFAIQCSNTAFNLAQAMRTRENEYETTFQLVRDFEPVTSGNDLWNHQA